MCDRYWENSLLSVSSRTAGTALLLLGASLVGCVTSNNPASPLAESTDRIRQVDLMPRFPQGANTVQTTGSESAARAATYYGDQSPAAVEARGPGAGAQRSDPGADPASTGALGDRAQPESSNSGYEMNFENTPVATVAKAILGDILALAYTIDPRVQGTVNLSSGRPVPRKDLLYSLESALRAINVALVRDGRGYRLVPVGDAVGTGSIDNNSQSAEAGYGISVVPLQYVSGQTLTKLLDNFAAKPGMVRAEPSRNLLIIQGNGADRRAAIETALSFDGDWMRGQSVGIYPVSNSTPEPVIAELERIIDSGEGGLAQNVVKLQAIARQNSILVVTRKPEFLDRVSTWIKRLDKSGSAGTGVKVYRMRFGEARQVAALLNDMFLGGSGGGLDSSTNQLIPGGGLTASSSGTAPASAPSGASQSAPSTAPAGFNARFADAAGGRSTTGANARGVSGGALGQAGPGSILQNVRIAADSVNNTLLIYANQEQYRIIERTLQQIDRPQLQVAIDATIAEVTLNDTLTYGVQFFLKSQNVGLKPDQGSVVNTLATAGATAAVSRVLPGFNFLAGTEADPRVIINALHTVTDVKILSTPSLVVIDNQFASLQVGDQIPITTQTAVSTLATGAPIVNNIDYRNTGVILRVAPRINANGNVLLDIEQEISAVSSTASTGTLTPTVSQRKVKSSIAVANGQTVLLAGLISERKERDGNGIPGLDQLPIIGPAFSTFNNGSLVRTELIIFIRPQIIRNGVDASRVASELRASMPRFRPGDSTPFATGGTYKLPPQRE